jgi:hypothetical protein
MGAMNDELSYVNVPRKMFKRFVICEAGLRTMEQIKFTTKRFAIKDFEKCMKHAEKSFASDGRNHDLMLIPRLATQNNPMQMVDSVEDIEKFRKRYAELKGANAPFEEVWYETFAQKRPSEVFGRQSFSLGGLFPRNTESVLEIIRAKTPRGFNDPQKCEGYLALRKENWGAKYETLKSVVNCPRGEWIEQNRDAIIEGLGARQMNLIKLGKILKAAGAGHMTIDFVCEDDNPRSIGIFDFDTGNDDTVLTNLEKAKRDGFKATDLIDRF